MSSQNDLRILERAVEARARILRAEADRTGSAVALLVLTLDVGCIAIRASETGLVVEHLDPPTLRPAGLEPLDEEEPWWRLRGQPLTAAWPGGVEDGVGAIGLDASMILKLRFREESENPRVVRLEATGPLVRISLD